MIGMRIAGAAFAACASLSATAEPVAFEDAIAAFAGTEVTASGRLTYWSAASIGFFAPGEHSFSADFAVDRDTLKTIAEGCERDRVRNLQAFCSADITAEIVVNGSEIRLLIFDVRNLVIPE